MKYLIGLLLNNLFTKSIATEAVAVAEVVAVFGRKKDLCVEFSGEVGTKRNIKLQWQCRLVNI